MAQHNLVLGTAIKSVGDITLYRRGGKQISRIRVRDVANPRTEAQAITRNFLAPVIKFYAPFATELKRSFEGLDTSRSYNEYQRVNINLARKEQWFLPKGESFYPLPYQVSRGRLMPVTYYMGEDEYEHTLIIGEQTQASSIVTIGDLSRKFVAWGYKNGDVATLLLVLQDETGAFVPDSGQMIINVNDTSDITTLGITSIRFTYANFRLAVVGRVSTLVAGAVIVSRYYKRRWLRSTQRLAVAPNIVAELVSATNRAASIESYERGGSSDDGPVYPGGDGQAYNVTTVSGRALLFYGGQYSASIDRSTGINFAMLKPANIDALFYLQFTARGYLVTGSSASYNPSDWYVGAGIPVAANADNTIAFNTESDFYRYLQSIGYNGA